MSDDFAELDAFLAELDAKLAASTDELATLRAESAAEMRDIEQQNRRGERGPEWERLQRRIDDGETTLGGVLRGEDASPDADAVQRFGAENMAAALEELRAREAEMNEEDE